MKSVLTVYRKELSDHFSSNRFLILLGLIVAALVTFLSTLVKIRRERREIRRISQWARRRNKW